MSDDVAKPNKPMDSLFLVGDLADLSQISRTGAVITLLGKEGSRDLILHNEKMAASFWEALSEEAALAVAEDRQFFCLSYNTEEIHTGSTH